MVYWFVNVNVTNVFPKDSSPPALRAISLYCPGSKGPAPREVEGGGKYAINLMYLECKLSKFPMIPLGLGAMSLECERCDSTPDMIRVGLCGSGQTYWCRQDVPTSCLNRSK